MSESQSSSLVLVEDNELDLKQTQREFRRWAIANQIAYAASGESALELLNERKQQDRIPDIILLDIHLPKMSGLDLLRVIRNESRFDSTKVLVLTSSRGDRDFYDSFDVIADGFIEKPITLWGLIEALAGESEFQLCLRRTRRSQ